MVLGRELAVEPARKRLCERLSSNYFSRLAAPAIALREAWECCRGDELAGRFGNEMIVGGRRAAWKRGETSVMIVKLVQDLRIAFEQTRSLGPLVQKPTGPDP